MKLYSAGCDNNWGDIFGPFLLRNRGLAVELVSPEKADLFCVGSILHNIPNNYTGRVFGTGAMFEHNFFDLTKATVLGLRGKLSLARCSIRFIRNPPILGDPGLLAYLFAPPRTYKFKYGIVPHFMDKKNPQVQAWAKKEDALVINIQAGVQPVINDAASCEKIVSSSLHGLVLADALGIPNQWVELSQEVNGKGFKFRDYYSAFGEDAVKASSIEEAFGKVRDRSTETVKGMLLEALDSMILDIHKAPR